MSWSTFSTDGLFKICFLSFLISLKCFITFLVIQLGTYLERSRYTILFKCATSLILQTSSILKVATQKCAKTAMSYLWTTPVHLGTKLCKQSSIVAGLHLYLNAKNVQSSIVAGLPLYPNEK